jgi:Rrf2 family protein
MFNKETEYALRGLVYIKMQNMKMKRPGTLEIAREIDAPPFFTAKILQRLVRSGFVKSAKGKGGGFFFDENGPDIPLLKLIASTEGESLISSCVFGLKHCDDNNPCPLHEKYAPIRDSISKMISGESVTSLAQIMYNKELSASKKEVVKKKKNSL